jgi:hypothetical protein
LKSIAGKPAPAGVNIQPYKCVHITVTIGVIFVCTFCFFALKSYISLPDTPRHSFLKTLRKNKYLRNRSTYFARFSAV